MPKRPPSDAMKSYVSLGLSVLETVVAVALTAIVSRLLPLETFGIYSTILSMLFMFSALGALGMGPIVLRETAALKKSGERNPHSLWSTADFMVMPTTLLTSSPP